MMCSPPKYWVPMWENRNDNGVGVCQSGYSRETEPIWTMPSEISYRNVLTWFSSVKLLSRVWLCDPRDYSTSDLPVHHQLLGFTQTHVHQVGDAIQPSHLLSSPSPLPSIFPSIRVSSNESVLHIRWPKYWSFSISLSNEYSGLISFRMDWLDLLLCHGVTF